MSFAVTPSTAAPGASVTAKGTAKRKTATRIRVDGVLVLSFTTGSSGSFSRTIAVPSGADRVVPVVLQQRRTDGIWAQTASANLTIHNIVVTPPPTGITFQTTIAAGATLKDTVDWQANNLSKPPTHVEFRIDGAIHWNELEAPWGGALDTTALTDGTHTLQVIAYDAAGAYPGPTITVTASNAVVVPPPPPPPPPPPTGITFTTTVASGAVLSGTANWEAINLSSTPTHVRFLVDGVQKWDEFFVPWGGDLDTKLWANGPHTLQVIAYDVAGSYPGPVLTVSINNVVVPPTLPPAPTNVKATPRDKSVALTWS